MLHLSKVRRKRGELRCPYPGDNERAISLCIEGHRTAGSEMNVHPHLVPIRGWWGHDCRARRYRSTECGHRHSGDESRWHSGPQRTFERMDDVLWVGSFAPNRDGDAKEHPFSGHTRGRATRIPNWAGPPLRHLGVSTDTGRRGRCDICVGDPKAAQFSSYAGRQERLSLETK